MKIHTLDINKVLKEVYVISALICASLALPFLFHLLPQPGSIPIGAIFLPIFYAPLVGAILFKKRTGIITALLAPFFNNLATGSPAGIMVLLLTLEMLILLGIYSFMTERVNLSGRFGSRDMLNVAISYVISVFFCVGIFGIVPGFIVGGNNIIVFLKTLYISFPGVIILCFITYALNKYKKSYDRT